MASSKNNYMAVGQNPGTPVNIPKAIKTEGNHPQKGGLGFDPLPYSYRWFWHTENIQATILQNLPPLTNDAKLLSDDLRHFLHLNFSWKTS